MLKITVLALALTVLSGAAAGPSSSPNAEELNLETLIDEGKRAFEREDYATARRRWEPAAAAGSVQALALLATLYQDGLGVKRDYVKARELYERVAAAPGADLQPLRRTALATLGYFHQEGLGVARDLGQAQRWYEKAAAAGNGDAMLNLGMTYDEQGEYGPALQWYKRAAASADFPAARAQAQTNVGLMYLEGLGVAKDYREARRWLDRAAAVDFPQAQLTLGGIYLEGVEEKQDLAAARRWFEKAANQRQNEFIGDKARAGLRAVERQSQ